MNDEVLNAAKEEDIWLAGMDPYQEQLDRLAARIRRDERNRIATILEGEDLSMLSDSPPLQKYTAELLCGLATFLRNAS